MVAKMELDTKAMSGTEVVRKLPQIILETVPPQEKPAEDPTLCLWAEWHFMVALAAAEYGDRQAQQIVQGNTIKAEIVMPDGKTHQTSILLKGFRLELDGLTTKFGQPTALILEGEYKGWIVYRSEGVFHFGRQIDLSQVYTTTQPWRESGQLDKMRYQKAQDTLLAKALDHIKKGEGFTGSPTRVLFDQATAALVGSKEE